jgi:hypothetical protein
MYSSVERYNDYALHPLFLIDRPFRMPLSSTSRQALVAIVGDFEAVLERSLRLVDKKWFAKKDGHVGLGV